MELMQSLKYKLLENEESFGHWDCVNRPMRGQQPIPLHKAHSSEPKQQQRSMKQAVPPSPAPERCAGCHGEQPCTPRAGRRRRGGKSFVSLSPNGGLHSEHPRLNRGCTWLGFSRNSRTHGSKTEGFGRSDSVLKCPDTHHLDFPAVENFQQRFHHHHHPSPARHSPGARRACSCAPAGSPNPPPAPPGAALSSVPLSRGPRWNFQHRHPPTNSGIVRGGRTVASEPHGNGKRFLEWYRKVPRRHRCASPRSPDASGARCGSCQGHGIFQEPGRARCRQLWGMATTPTPQSNGVRKTPEPCPPPPAGLGRALPSPSPPLLAPILTATARSARSTPRSGGAEPAGAPPRAARARGSPPAGPAAQDPPPPWGGAGHKGGGAGAGPGARPRCAPRRRRKGRSGSWWRGRARPRPPRGAVRGCGEARG